MDYLALVLLKSFVDTEACHSEIKYYIKELMHYLFIKNVILVFLCTNVEHLLHLQVHLPI